MSPAEIATITDINASARLEALQVAFALVGLVAIGALFVTSRIPTKPPGSTVEAGDDPNAVTPPPE